MTSLVLARWRPDKPTGGAPLRNWQNIRALGLLGPVDVLSVGVDEMSEPVDGVREWVPFSLRHRTIQDRIRAQCWLLRRDGYRSMDEYFVQSVTRWLSAYATTPSYDVAVVEGISLASYVGPLKRLGCRVVFDAHNAESVLHREITTSPSGRQAAVVRRAKNRFLQGRMARAERRAVRTADIVWACSEGDARQIERDYQMPSPVTVVPNAVDVERYQSGAPVSGGDWARLPITMIYAGLFGYPPNEDASIRLVTQVLPAVRAYGHRARVVLVGRGPTPRMLAAARDDPGIEITGAVDSVLPYLEQPCVATLPITLGSGTRLKILEAFAAGTPVVSTAKGAEGIAAVDGEHALIREDADAIARAVIELWTRVSFRQGMCARALDLVRSHYSWPIAAQRIAESLGRRAGGA